MANQKPVRNFFSPVDFIELNHQEGVCSTFHAAHTANLLFNRFVDSWPVVYGSVGATPKTYEWSTHMLTTDTHQARLAFLEEIKKEEECSHVPDFSTFKFNVVDGAVYAIDFGRLTCEKCGNKLEIAWKAKK